MTSTGNIKMGRQAVLLLAAIMAALLLSSGVALAVTKQCQAQVECFGTPEPDTLNGTTGNDLMFARGAADILKGFGANDVLYGEAGGDELYGHGGPVDHLIGGPGNDELFGGGGEDFYFFGPDWGKDSITDSLTTTNEVQFRRDPFEKPPVSVTEDLSIRLTSGAGPEVKNASGTNTLEWDDSVITDVFGGVGDDKITGNFLPNTIRTTAGEDTVFGRGGDDEIYVDDSVGDDVVNCGEDLIGGPDHDIVYYDPDDTISTNCEEKGIAPSWG